MCYLASEYRDLIVPKGQALITSFKVPVSYELKIYGQNVPDVISSTFGNLELLVPRIFILSSLNPL
jgi:hypothetical protein